MFPIMSIGKPFTKIVQLTSNCDNAKATSILFGSFQLGAISKKGSNALLTSSVISELIFIFLFQANKPHYLSASVATL